MDISDQTNNVRFAWPLILKVQMLNGASVVYEKKMKLSISKNVFINSMASNKETIYFPLSQENEKIPFLTCCKENLQLKIDSHWNGFYVVNNKIFDFNQQEEFINLPPDSYGSFQHEDYCLNWQILSEDTKPTEARAKGGFLRVLFHQTAEIQNATIAAVMMLILCSITGIFVSRIQKQSGYLNNLSQRQLLLLIHQDHIQTAPEYIDDVSQKNFLANVIKFYHEYSQVILSNNLKPSQSIQNLTKHHTLTNKKYLQLRKDVIKTNLDTKESKLVIPAIVGETQTTKLWRLLEKISFIHSGSKILLSSRNTLNQQLNGQQPYLYNSPESAKPKKLAMNTSIAPEKYIIAQKLARSSLRKNQGDAFFYAELRNQASLYQPLSLKTDFKLASFTPLNQLNKKLSQTPQSPKTTQKY